MSKRVAAVLLVAAVAGAACAGHTGAGGSGGSGIRGQVLIGPRCPVERANSPCPDQPLRAIVTVKGAAGRFYPPVRTGGDGRFAIDLPAGTYEVFAHEISDNPRIARPRVVTVRPGAFVSVTLTIDSGIR